MAKNILPLAEYPIIWDGQGIIALLSKEGRQIKAHPVGVWGVAEDFKKYKGTSSSQEQRGTQPKHLKGEIEGALKVKHRRLGQKGKTGIGGVGVGGWPDVLTCEELKREIVERLEGRGALGGLQ